MRWFRYTLIVVIVLVLVRWSFYTVDAAEYAYVTVLGEPVATHDGADGETGAGLHVGWPWPIQAVQRLDRRLQQFDLPATELLTHDPDGKTIDKMMMVEAYVLWRIAGRDFVDRFVRSLGTPERARSFLGPRINSQLGAAIAQLRMDDLVSTDAGQQPGRTRVDDTLDRLQARLLAGLQERVRDEYGVEIVDIRLRRITYPGQVREEIFKRIRSERFKKVTAYQSEGERQARNIESAAEEKVRDLLAKARFDEERLKGQADTEALRIRNQAQSQDPEFYAFLKQMEQLTSILGDNKTMLLLSTHRPLFERLFQPPRPQAAPMEKSLKQDTKDGKE
ncbi:MAG: protease modulator HflC [Gemmataceae bacterium]|nr:protease modulator HflC [Gemmataceae bacterium]